MYQFILFVVVWNSNSKFYDLKKGFRPLPLFSFLAVELLAGVLIYFLKSYYLSTTQIQLLLKNLDLIDIQLYAALALFLITNPLLEELFWRDWMNSGKWVGIEDIAFGFYHVLVLVLLFDMLVCLVLGLLLTCTSIFWKYLSRKYRGACIPLCMHALADFFVILYLL